VSVRRWRDKDPHMHTHARHFDLHSACLPPPSHVFLSRVCAVVLPSKPPFLRRCLVHQPTSLLHFRFQATFSFDFSPVVHVLPWTRAIPCTPPFFFTYFMVFFNRRPRGRCSITYRTNLKSIPRKKKGAFALLLTITHPSTNHQSACHCLFSFLFFYLLPHHYPVRVRVPALVCAELSAFIQ